VVTHLRVVPDERPTDDRVAAVWAALAEVPDPEIPTISVVDLGIVRSAEFSSTGDLRVELMPTFIGCPATAVMRDAVEQRLIGLGVANEVEVVITFAEPWTSDRITPAGRAHLRTSGFAPPPPADTELPMLASVACPYCGSTATGMDNAFGPTLCRAIYFCNGCRQPFEQFKPI
jgi:ring-1,2-phenylacetyl-CoA epoxidase subunit PaaD